MIRLPKINNYKFFDNFNNLNLLICISLLIIFPNLIKTKINCSNNTSTIEITGTAGKIIFNTPINNFSGTILVNNKENITVNTHIKPITFDSYGQIIYKENIPIAESCNPINHSMNNVIFLDSGKTLKGDPYYKITDPILISGIDNNIIGNPDFKSPITLLDSNTTVSIGIECKLTSNIIMNGGSVYLTKDLKLKDEVSITGSGKIYFNGYSLLYPLYISSGPITSSLTMINANDITINTRTSQTGNTTFEGVNNILGNGVILDFTGGGSFTINDGATVYMNGLHIKGLGSVGGGNLILNNNSKLYLTECILELSGTYTQTNGEMIIEGGMCKIISNTGSEYVVSGESSKLTVNGQQLWYENSNQFPTFPFKAVSSGTIETINNGSITTNYIPGSSYDIKLYSNSSSGAVNSTDVNIILAAGQTITFFNENPAVAKNMTFDCKTNAISFNDTVSQSIIVQPNITLTIQNVKFENFDPSQFLLMGSGDSQAKLIFGDNVDFEIHKELTLAPGAIPINGNVKFFGNSKRELHLQSQSITFTGASKSLHFNGLHLTFLAHDGLKCNSYTSTVAIHHCDLLMTNTGITFDSGFLEIEGQVKFLGQSESVEDPISFLTFSSKGLLTIRPKSKLSFGIDCGLNLFPDVSQDFGNESIEKRHLILQDHSSILQFNKSVLDTGPKGLALDHGKVIIKDNVTCNTSFTVGSEFELGSNVNFTVLERATFNVNGSLKYLVST